MAAANPFLSLFVSPEAAQRSSDSRERDAQELSDLLMRIFLFSASSPGSEEIVGGRRPKFVVLLPQLSRDEQRSGKSGELDVENYVQGLMERLQMSSLDTNLHCNPGGLDKGLFSREKATMPTGVVFLAHCFARASMEPTDSKRVSDWKHQAIQQCKTKISELACPLICTAHSMALLQSRAQTTSPFTDLLFQSLSGSSPIPMEFFTKIADAQVENSTALKTIFDPALKKLFDGCQSLTLSSPDLGLYFSVLEFYSSHPTLAKVLVNSPYWLPGARAGNFFETHTLIGRLLKPSSLPPSPLLPSEHFSHTHDLYQTEVNTTTASLQIQLEGVTERAHKVFDGLLRSSPESRKALISWLVECFEKNQDRAKMMSRFTARGGLFDHSRFCSDGFFLNLSWTLLRLCAPFMSGRKTLLQGIDPSYCSAPKEEVKTVDSGGPLVDFSGETKLVPSSRESDSESNTAPQAPFNFVTHCFFLTHRCLILGMTQVLHRFEDIMRAYGRVFEMMQSAREGGGNLFQQARLRFRLLQSQVLGLKAHAMHPQLLDLCLSLYTTTAQWLVQLVARGSRDSQVMSPDLSTLFPLPEKSPVQLEMIPECLVENMADYAMFLKQTQSDTLANNSHNMHHLITFVTVFMGSPQLIHNPHIRARLSQLLSLMMPREDTPTGLIPAENQKALFESHLLASSHLIEALMTIFVDIEFTGESMEFEDKFQYRIPMYQILEFLWKLPSYRPSILTLSQQAVQSAVFLETPIFLRFINMMINDATVQLDEGLENLAQIKKIEDVKESEEWQSFNDEQKKEHQQKLTEATMLAKNRNLLASKTVHALEFISADLTKPFVIPTMLDRMVAMLNYILDKLVGPKNKELKVKNASKYHFDPKSLVSGIISIYLHLGREECFCEALPRDGRSFSMDLFSQTLRVLRILGKPPEMLGELQTLAERVRLCQQRLEEEKQAFEEAPEEFLDPLTCEIMSDPVILPTSGKTMDRANVIRHLLSDQCDPFNREPLTADMLRPDAELKQKIHEWKTQILMQSSKTF